MGRCHLIQTVHFKELFVEEDWSTEYFQMIDDCEHRSSRLTEWEITFLDSLSSQLMQGRRPTPKQSETLEKIWAQATKKG